MARADHELEAADCFTELGLETQVEEEDFKNVSTKSIILAPFNSTKSNIENAAFETEADVFKWNERVKFAARCREVDR